MIQDDWQETRGGILLMAFAGATAMAVISCIALTILHVGTRVVRG